jgi:hypothetical protein
MITLNTPGAILIQPASSLPVTTVTVERVVDIPEFKIVELYITSYPFPIRLWEGSSYDAIGQWTDSDVTARVQTMATSHIAPFI